MGFIMRFISQMLRAIFVNQSIDGKTLKKCVYWWLWQMFMKLANFFFFFEKFEYLFLAKTWCYVMNWKFFEVLIDWWNMRAGKRLCFFFQFSLFWNESPAINWINLYSNKKLENWAIKAKNNGNLEKKVKILDISKIFFCSPPIQIDQTQ